MKAKLLVGALLTGGLFAAGCHSAPKPDWHGDPCWPERYSNEARALTVGAFEAQVANGHVLDQTIWNSHFDYGAEKLNAAGMDKLDQLARRRPGPDTRIFLQTTRDIGYDADKPEAYAAKRSDLDAKRIASVKKYLSATLTGRPGTFEVEVHDPSAPGIDGSAARVQAGKASAGGAAQPAGGAASSPGASAAGGSGRP